MMVLRWIPLTALLILVTGCFYIAVEERRFTKWQWVSLGGAYLYLLTVIWLCFYPAGLPFIPVGEKPLMYFNHVPYNLHPLQYLTIDWFENILLTIPMGMLTYLLQDRFSLGSMIFVALIPGVTIEAIQMFADLLVNLHRVVDIDDVITNWLGMMIGYGLMKFLAKIGFKRLIAAFEF